MRKTLAIIFALIAWFAVLTQYYLMIDNRVVSFWEITIRFFSYFTILTNTLVAVYFSKEAFRQNSERKNFLDNPGSLTAVTVYIVVVGLVYQVMLRKLWEPTGIHMIVDELLHSIIPLCVIAYWYLYERKTKIRLSQIPAWLLYPIIYLLYILVRGKLSGFFPYPFINVSDLGFRKVILNSTVLMILFVFLSIVFVGIGKWIEKKRIPNDNLDLN